MKALVVVGSGIKPLGITYEEMMKKEGVYIPIRQNGNTDGLKSVRLIVVNGSTAGALLLYVNGSILAHAGSGWRDAAYCFIPTDEKITITLNGDTQ